MLICLHLSTEPHACPLLYLFFNTLASKGTHRCKHTYAYMNTVTHKALALTCEHVHTPTQHAHTQLYPHSPICVCLYVCTYACIHTCIHVCVLLQSITSLEDFHHCSLLKRRGRTHTPNFDTHKFQQAEPCSGYDPLEFNNILADAAI